MRPLQLLLLCATIPTVLPAQDQSSAALVLRTNNAELAASMLSSFDPEAEAPAMSDGSHIVLTLDDGGKISASTSEGEAPYMSLQARPADLMEIFSNDVDGAQQMAQGMGGMAAGSMGIDFADVATIVGGIFSFPRQIESLSLEVAEDPGSSMDLNADIQITPKADTWFGNLVDATQLNSEGRMAITDANAMMTMDSNLDIAKLGEVLRPIFALMAKMTAKSGDDLAKAAKVIDDYFKASDGTMSMSFNPGQSGMRTLVGLRDAELSSSLLYGEGFAELYEIQQRKNRMVEFEVEQKALEHRDIQVVKVTQTSEAQGMMGPNPFAGPDGSMVNYYAVAGGVLLMAGNGAGTGEIKALIDSALDGNLTREPLGKDVLATAVFRIKDLAGAFGGMAGAPPGTEDEMPETMTLDLKKTGKSLKLEVSSK
ncbi:MAG: hypothetical protein ACYTG5_08545 [Planctomycetota bacterium]|jgi:hypothetical protein